MEHSTFYKRLFISQGIEPALTKINLDLFELCWNPNISIEFLEKTIDEKIESLCSTIDPNTPRDITNTSLKEIFHYTHFWGISQNKYLTIEVIARFSQKYKITWKMNMFGQNPNLFVEQIFLYPELLNFSDFGYNNNTTIEIIEKYIQNPVKIDEKHISEWDWEKLSLNKNITNEFIEKYIDKPWNWNYLAIMKNIISENFIEKYIDKPWDFNQLSTKSNMIPIALRHSHKHWNWYSLLYYNQPSCENIQKILEINPNLEIDWSKISINPNITEEFFLKHFDKPWDYYTMYKNTKFMEKISKKLYELISNPNYWNWKKMSENIYLTVDTVKKFPDFDWDWKKISTNIRIKEKWLQNFPKKPWNWDDVVRRLCYEISIFTKHSISVEKYVKNICPVYIYNY